LGAGAWRSRPRTPPGLAPRPPACPHPRPDPALGFRVWGTPARGPRGWGRRGQARLRPCTRGPPRPSPGGQAFACMLPPPTQPVRRLQRPCCTCRPRRSRRAATPAGRPADRAVPKTPPGAPTPQALGPACGFGIVHGWRPTPEGSVRLGGRRGRSRGAIVCPRPRHRPRAPAGAQGGQARPQAPAVQRVRRGSPRPWPRGLHTARAARAAGGAGGGRRGRRGRAAPARPRWPTASMTRPPAACASTPSTRVHAQRRAGPRRGRAGRGGRRPAWGRRTGVRRRRTEPARAPPPRHRPLALASYRPASLTRAPPLSHSPRPPLPAAPTEGRKPWDLGCGHSYCEACLRESPRSFRSCPGEGGNGMG
jgi:hypothetical protein